MEQVDPGVLRLHLSQPSNRKMVRRNRRIWRAQPPVKINRRVGARHCQPGEVLTGVIHTDETSAAADRFRIIDANTHRRACGHEASSGGGHAEESRLGWGVAFGGLAVVRRGELAELL